MKPILPERHTGRAETAAYLTLAAAGLAAVVLALFSSVGFGRDIDVLTVRLRQERDAHNRSLAVSDGIGATNLAGALGNPPALPPTNLHGLRPQTATTAGAGSSG